MRNNSKFLCIVCAMGLLTLCCDEDNDTSDTNGACKTAGYVSCNGRCINPTTSSDYCGANEYCEGYEICKENQSCQAGKCIDKSEEPKDCNPPCEADQSCQNGKCADKTHCSTGEWKCESNKLSKCQTGEWESIETCPENTQCNAETGSCQKTDSPKTECLDTEHLFANKCEPDSLTHCGAHGSQCHVENATYTCTAGKCVFTCLDGYQIYKNTCRNIPEIIVFSTGTSISENSAETIEFKVALSAQPDNQVTIKSKSSDKSELKIMTQPILLFNEENWNLPQTVMLRVQDDNYADGTQIVHIDLASSSEDPYFDGLNARTEDFAIIDDESASVAVTVAKNRFKPGDPNTTPFWVALSAPPISDVHVKLTVSNNEVIKLPNLNLVFTPDNWYTPQEMTMTVLPDAVEGDCSTIWISATASGSGSYNGLKSNNVEIRVYRNLNNPNCQ